jgi:hypothetical protein
MRHMPELRISDYTVWQFLSENDSMNNQRPYTIQDLEYVVAQAYRRAFASGARISLCYDQEHTCWTMDYDRNRIPSIRTIRGWKAKGSA